jgi:hypothetical protein
LPIPYIFNGGSPLKMPALPEPGLFSFVSERNPVNVLIHHSLAKGVKIIALFGFLSNGLGHRRLTLDSIPRPDSWARAFHLAGMR